MRIDSLGAGGPRRDREAIIETKPSLWRASAGALFLLASYGILMGALPA